MENTFNLVSILDTAVKDISTKVAKLNISKTIPCPIDSSSTASLSITTSGDYRLTIIFHADMQLFRIIAKNMKRKELTDDTDLEIYVTEFFNVLCGHVVSMINNHINRSARFGIPSFYKGFYELQSPDNQDYHQTIYYRCDYGVIEIETYGYVNDQLQS